MATLYTHMCIYPVVPFIIHFSFSFASDLCHEFALNSNPNLYKNYILFWELNPRFIFEISKSGNTATVIGGVFHRDVLQGDV